jgi:hypothetical protein
MRLTTTLAALSALCGGCACYKPATSDSQRDEMFKACAKDFAFVAKAAEEHSGRTEGNMAQCAEKCSVKLRDSAYGNYVKCFSCCDAFYGRTPEEDRMLEVPPTQVGVEVFHSSFEKF